MTRLPKTDFTTRVTVLKAMSLRVLSYIIGLGTILIGMVLSVFYFVSSDSAWSLLPALGFVVLCGFVAYR